MTEGERLGWRRNDRALLIHTDDAGLNAAANAGAIAAWESGVSRSMSVMMPCPGAESMAAWLQRRPEADAGVHLTLTSEFDHFRWGPLAGREAVPSLVDETGHFWKTSHAFRNHATPSDVHAEISAQWEAALAMGIQPTHLDSHMATLFLREDLFAVYAGFAIAHGVPALAFPPPARLPFLAAKAWARLARRPWPKLPPPPRQHLDRLRRNGLPLADRVNADSIAWPPHTKTKRLAKLVASLPPGITVVLLHCAAEDSSLGNIEGGASSRLADTAAALAPEVREAIEQHGVHLTSWRELHARARAAGRAGN